MNELLAENKELLSKVIQGSLKIVNAPLESSQIIAGEAEGGTT